MSVAEPGQGAGTGSGAGKGDGGGIAALLLVSVSVTCAGQTPVPLLDDGGGGGDADSGDEGDGDGGGENILMPPTLERVGCVLNVAVYRAVGLPQMDFTVGTALGQTAGIDAYVRVRFAGGPWARTKMVKSRAPDFHQLLAVAVVLPSMADEIEVQVCDGDVMDADDVVGTIVLSLRHLQKLPSAYHKPSWFHMYGAPADTDSWPALPGPLGRLRRRAEQMNNGLLEGSAWRGKLLMSLSVTPMELKLLPRASDAPRSVRPVKEVSPTNSDAHVVQVYLLQAVGLPPNSRVQVDIACGSASMMSKVVETEGAGRASWGDSLVLLMDSVGPDVLVSVLVGGVRYAWMRARQSQLTDPCAAWRPLIRDEFTASSFPTPSLPPSLLFQAASGTGATGAEGGGGLPLSVTAKAIYHVLAHVYCMRECHTADDGSVASMCSVNMFVDGQSVACTEPKTVGGGEAVWLETLEAASAALPIDLSMAPPLVLTAQLHDTLDKGKAGARTPSPKASKVAGYARVDLAAWWRSRVSGGGQPDAPSSPQWYALDPITPGSEGGSGGGRGRGGGGGGGGTSGFVVAGREGTEDGPRLLVAVEVIMTALMDCSKCGARLPSNTRPDSSASGRTPCPKCAMPLSLPPPAWCQPPVTHMFPPRDPWDVLVLIIGVREIKSPSLLPLVKPHVTVACLGQSQQTIRSSTPSASSANYFQVLRIKNVLISREPTGMLAPLLSITVHERPLLPRWSGGGGDKSVGCVSMSLGEFLSLIPLHRRLAMRSARCGAPQPSPHSEDTAGGAISISSGDVAVMLDGSASAERKDGSVGVKSIRTVLVCSGGYTQYVEEKLVEGTVGARDAQEGFMEERAVINGELESALDLYGDTDPAEGWPTVTPLYKPRRKNKKKDGGGGKIQTGRIIAGVRLVPSDTLSPPGDSGAAAGGVADLMRWPGIGSLFGVGGGWGGGAPKVEVRIYVIDARGLAAEDTNRKSDPYLNVTLAGQSLDTRKSTRYACLDPVFHERFIFRVPIGVAGGSGGAGNLTVCCKVMDRDALSCDDEIGRTEIDLELRLLSRVWQRLGVSRTGATRSSQRALSAAAAAGGGGVQGEEEGEGAAGLQPRLLPCRDDRWSGGSYGCRGCRGRWEHVARLACGWIFSTLQRPLRTRRWILLCRSPRRTCFELSSGGFVGRGQWTRSLTRTTCSWSAGWKGRTQPTVRSFGSKSRRIRTGAARAARRRLITAGPSMSR